MNSSRSQHSSSSSSPSSSSSSSSSSPSPSERTSSSDSFSSPQYFGRDFMDPFSSFNRLRRQVDRMFRDFDRQMFGGFSSPFLIDEPFEMNRKLEGKGGRYNKQKQKQLSGKNEGGQMKEGEGGEKDQTIIQAVDGSNDNEDMNMDTNMLTTTNNQPLSNLLNWPFDLTSSSPSSPLSPMIKMDLIEEDNQYLLNADVPGFNRDELKLKIQDGMLTLSGESKKENEIKEK